MATYFGAGILISWSYHEFREGEIRFTELSIKARKIQLDARFTTPITLRTSNQNKNFCNRTSSTNERRDCASSALVR